MSTPETPKRPKAYSYIRFSTPEQRKGDSLGRQTRKAREYALEHGLELDTELDLQDLGVSGFRSKNASTGALGEFLRAVKEGRVASGSYLLIENVDRLTRATILEAQHLFTGLLLAGITVVTLTDGRKYSHEGVNASGAEILFLIVELLRANHESERKSQLVSSARERSRKRLVSGEPQTTPYTKQLPGWLIWNEDTKSYQIIPERAAVVRELFAMADAGRGSDRIAQELNARGEETWGKGKRKADHWRGAFVRKILSSKAPLGMFTPHRTTYDKATGRRRDVPWEPVKLWKPVVDEELYGRVSRKMQATAPRGRNAERASVSLVAGILKCAKCGRPVLRVKKGRSHKRGRENVYLVCSRAHARAAGCAYHAVRYRDVEEALRANANDIVRGAPRGHSTVEIEREIGNYTVVVDVLEDQVRDAAELAAEERSPGTLELLRTKEAELETARATLAELQTQQNTLTHASVKARLKVIRDTLTAKPFDVAAANAALKDAVKKITMDTEAATLELHWHHAEEPQEPIHFYSRHQIGNFDTEGEA